MKALVTLIVGLVVGGAIVYLWQPFGHGHGHGPIAAAAEGREILYYRNPMDSSVTSDVPAKDHMGMDYIPVYADGSEADQEPGIRIRPEVQQNLGVRVALAEQGDLTDRRHALGRVAFDESGLSHVHVRAEGWVEELPVRTTGAPVIKGQILFRLDSPRIRSAQEELLQALRRASGVEAARDRLRSLGMAAQDIRTLERQQQILQLVPVRARQSGVIQALSISEGMYVSPGNTLITLARLDPVWVMVDIFEPALHRLVEDAPALVTLPLQPGVQREAALDYLYPELSVSGRTLQARLILDNPDASLRPGMLAEVSMATRPIRNAVHVPAEAVIRTGRQDRVVLQLHDGRFQVREVRVGPRIADRLVVEEGLRAGDPVVVSGQFLMDSESRVTVTLERLKELEADARAEWVDHGEGHHHD